MPQFGDNKGLTDEHSLKLTKPARASMRVLQHSARAKGVSQSLNVQSTLAFKRIRSICVSRAPLTQCSSSEVLNHPGEATNAPSRRDIEEHRRSVGICLVNNSGLVFAARYFRPSPEEKLGLSVTVGQLCLYDACLCLGNALSFYV